MSEVGRYNLTSGTRCVCGSNHPGPEAASPGHPDITQQSRKGKAMKTLSFALLLAASAAFVLVGCSDNSGVPVSPTDQSVQRPGSLEKSNKVDVTFEEHNLPPAVPGKKWVEGRVLHITDVHAFEDVEGDSPLIAGTMEHYLNLSLDIYTGEGPCHGSWTLVPSDPSVTGVWEGTYEGYRSKTNDPSVFALPLKLVGHGRGGNIDGMQAKMTVTLRVLVWVGTPPPGIPPFPAPYYWSGNDGAGTIIQH
jgi:hypothetical protein